MPNKVFPWRHANQLNLLLDGPRFFPRMLARIAQAQQQIELELYLVESGACSNQLIDALCVAAQRGVRVRCLFDSFGVQRLLTRDRQRLVNAGVVLRLYNPLHWQHGLRNFHRDHRKLLLVDQHYAFVGGTGATDEFWQADRAPEANSVWHEAMVEISGPLVRDWQALFEWQWESYQAINTWRVWRPHGPARYRSLPPLPSRVGGLGRVAFADAWQRRDILLSLVRALRGAKQRIWLATPYFLPTWRVRRSLRQAAARGVDVRLLLSGQHTDHPPIRFAGQRYYASLLKAGVKIFEYQPQFLHLKMVLVDDWVSVGSCNFDHWNLRFNLDANLEALDPGFTAQVLSSFQHDFAQSTPISPQEWRRRPWYKRLQQSLWGTLDQLLVNLLDRRR
ncbi:phospholipase D-like domain-containing protein [Pseudomonas sp. 5P_3.1_Bac2]|uniref:phospholipase D-like domain-containing protein n=1 Tax=Pseudomonas sp. 5P_3.1_Bac2 TaxID=2971617 RepID=UPI0021C6C440|nr:phosphatidylserine/phosphatidylglycerophosphate/cardiolipin synthase family protein [Pseudomonas sp. 5P_3.1_Bac2]MCU1715670.1 phosphatidylserine/phosphatidylglycerophosphate/cardiolipin synthase family protein [Pseudomonas sp. 5P_3.1_Bac2]